MIRTSELEQAAADGASNQTVAQILGEGFRSVSAAEELHVHADHSLSLALERMGVSGLNVLPVVSRANVRQLMGIITLEDILKAYGVAKRARPREERESWRSSSQDDRS
jgi:predicted transcriptional regulator